LRSYWCKKLIDVLLTPHGPAFQDAVGINVSPVLRGNLASFGAPEIAVSFETNNLFGAKYHHAMRTSGRQPGGTG